MGAGVVRRWMVAFILAGLAVAPQMAQAGAGLGLEMVCADAVNAAPMPDRIPPFARLLGLMPAHPTPVPTALCLKGYEALVSPPAAVPAAATPPATAIPTPGEPAAPRDLAGERRALGLYTHYVGALLASLPADLAVRGDRVRAAAAVQLMVIGESLAASAYRPVAILSEAKDKPASSETGRVRMARLLRPDAETVSP
ncbi:hypothetical protein [Nitrospirillum sp. BR 11828]|uniref:hypothetical protein n=1 Tax=Nitrospirillum sp. BR 11828 TaxID=3104325 RepID=UPI002ACADABE|nr:hypothetical protein [Nitrospirillum sp. BR 11828]MDZ5648170.1 hypothetical protein [Nitrospirillum sp. BR 11828]